jgi:hypothetical protein
MAKPAAVNTNPKVRSHIPVHRGWLSLVGSEKGPTGGGPGQGTCCCRPQIGQLTSCPAFRVPMDSNFRHDRQRKRIAIAVPSPGCRCTTIWVLRVWNWDPTAMRRLFEKNHRDQRKGRKAGCTATFESQPGCRLFATVRKTY